MSISRIRARDVIVYIWREESDRDGVDKVQALYLTLAADGLRAILYIAFDGLRDARGLCGL